MMDVGEELAVPRRLLERLKANKPKLYLNRQDATQREMEKLGPDIAYLEGVLAQTVRGRN